MNYISAMDFNNEVSTLVFKPNNDREIELQRENESLKIEIEALKVSPTSTGGSKFSPFLYILIGFCIGLLLAWGVYQRGTTHLFL